MQLTLADPGPLARAAAFTEVLARPHDQRSTVYADHAWRARARVDFAQAWGDRLARMFVQETELHTELRDGPSIKDLAATRGVDAFDLLCDLALAEGLRTRFKVVLANDDEQLLADLLSDDRILVGLSDAGAHASQLCDAVFSTHLLQHWVRETGVLTLERAVWRITGHPAQVFGLPDRGRIAAGAYADLVAFDPETIAIEPMERVFDFPAGADRLIARSRGIEAMWVNGTAVREDGKDLDGVRPGELIRDGGQ
jgi:N-acyl-D-aspartate/D-glutamate deacylase